MSSAYIKRRQCQPHQFEQTVSPLLSRIYSARGAVANNDIDYRLKHLLVPQSLKGLDDALMLLEGALVEQQRVLIVGDFDADGATSCALAIKALTAMGLQSVDYLVPNRFDYGYGLSPEIVDVAAALKPDLIITVDNGIASIEGVARAKQLGIQVIITDHHLPPADLPLADAIVNPNQLGCEFASKHLAGVGVIFYLLSALRSLLRQKNWFVQHQLVEPNMAEYLDLVALGTVADVVPLDHNNRILVEQGIQRIRAGQCRPGILALLSVAGKTHEKLSSTDFGFIIGPRLNAAGRLDDISVGIQCLLSDNMDEALTIAAELDALNRDRRAIESAMKQEAESALQTMSLSADALPWGLCLYHEQWHQGVVGILASRIKEQYHRPVIAFAKVDEHTIKGSARSIPSLHIRDALDALATENPDILQKFGGHAMAAGLSLRIEHFELFCEQFDAIVRARLKPDDLSEQWLTDGALSPQELSLQTAQELQEAGPWGQQFTEPLFDGEFLLLQQRIVGEKHLKMVLAPIETPQATIDAIMFNIDLNQWPNLDIERVVAVYQLGVNEYRGMETAQMLVRHLSAGSQ